MKDKNITDAKRLEAYYLGKLFEIIEAFPQDKKSYAGKKASPSLKIKENSH